MNDLSPHLPINHSLQKMATREGDMEQKPPHLVLVPFMAQGHIIPMADIARLLAARGATVTLATTPLNAARIRPVIDLMTASSLPVRLLELPFPCSDAGLPDGCESADSITSGDQVIPFFKSSRLLYNPLLHHLKVLSPAPTCLVSDMFHPWTAELARELHIRRFVFHGSSCFYILCVHLIQKSGICATLENDLEPFLVPGLPNHHKIAVNKATSPGFFDLAEMEELARDAAEAETTADGILLNSFVDLEPEFIDLYEEAVSTKVWPIGPLSLCHKDPATRGGKASVNDHAVLGWLDAMEEGSVVYFSFGSLILTSFKQTVEIGLGLEAAGRPFAWVVKEAEKSPEVEKWVSEMQERTEGRGVIIRGWAPQVAILNHAAVGGFVTHCGWNSTLEAVAAGVPVVTWPWGADQFLNERLVVEELGVGVKVGVAAPVAYFGGGTDGVAVRREGVEMAIDRLMDGGEEAEERREKARELGRKARMAMEEGGSSYESLTKLMEHLLQPMEVKTV